MAEPSGPRIPPRLEVTYGWGSLGTLSGGQDKTREFKDQFQPDQGIFSPSYPLVPVDPERVRVWDYPVGYNYIYTPRSYEPIGFAELRALAQNHDLTRLAIETRKDQIEKLDWSIKPRDEKSPGPNADSRIKTLTEFWRHPDGERPFGSWLREALEDVLVLDAPAFEIRRQRDGQIIGIDSVAGDTIKLLVDITGRRPVPPAPAYEQVIHGRPWRLLTTDEMIYWPRNSRPHKIYGFGPVEQIIMTINTGLRRQLMQLQHFTDGNVPVGLLGLPDLNADQVQQVREYFDTILAGNTAERQRIHFAPFAAKYQAFKEPPIKDEFDEWLARVVMFCFSLPPDAFVRQRNRATAQTARQTALEEGLAPLMGWVKRLVDHVVQRRMGHDDLEFSWQEIREQDPKDQAVVLSTYVKEGIYAPNEAREVLGMDPVEGGDEPMFILPTGPVLLSHVEQVSDRTANPPEPPQMLPGPPRPGGQADAGGAERPGVRPDRSPPGQGAGAAQSKPEVGKAAADTFPAARAPSSFAARARAQRPLDAAARASLAREARLLSRRASQARIGSDSRTS
jgi:HK97 family phage portal protein